MDDWLVSVVKGDKVVELYYSESLQDIGAIRAMHKDCEIEPIWIGGDRKKSTAQDGIKKKTRWQTRRIKCEETGEIYESAAECAKANGVSRVNIYKAIQRGIAAGGKHFDYIE